MSSKKDKDLDDLHADGKSLHEVARELNLTYEQVRTAERNAIKKFRLALLARKIHRKDLFP